MRFPMAFSGPFRAVLASLALILGMSPLSATKIELVPARVNWRFKPGNTEASTPDITAWRQVGFSDATWASGPLPLFYGENLTGTLITGMQNNYTTYFTRIRFDLGSPADFRSFVFQAACDDGFIAWINGQEIARYNVPAGEPTFTWSANGAVPEPAAWNDYPIDGLEKVLRAGPNILAVQLFNAGRSSSDLVFDARLIAELDDEPPVIGLILPEPGSTLPELTSIEVQFSEPVRGVDAPDLLINGTPASSISQPGPGQFVFGFTRPAPGPVDVRFKPDHGITDLSSAQRPLQPAPWSYLIDTNATFSLRINEFLAQNDRGIRDEDGTRSDWIELHNPDSQAVSLEGWSLTDDALLPRKWILPAVSIPANGYTLIWASGNNRTNPAAPLHTNFRLTSDGEYLALVSPGGDVVSAFDPAFPPQRADVSFGRVPGIVTNGFLPNPTPRAPNAAGGIGFAPDLRFTPPGIPYLTNIQVQVTPDITQGIVPDGFVIRFTRDGSLPGENSPILNGPLNLTNQAVQIRARGFAPGLLPGRPRSEMYLPLSPTVARFTSDIPVLIIHDFNRGRPPANTRIPAYFQVFEPDTNGLVSFTNPPAMTARAGISVRGSSTEGLAKASLRVEFRDEFDNNEDREFLGMPAEDDWILYAPNHFEPVLIHNPFMHQLSRDIGRYSPRHRLCEVFLVTSGTNAIQFTSFNGVYVALERIEIDRDRVDLGGLQPENLTQPSITGGYLMKIDRLDPGDSGISAGGLTFGMVDPSETELRQPARAPQLNYLRNYVNAFANTLYSSNYRNPVTGYRAYVDTPSWVDHHLLNVVAFNVDALRLSAYFGKRREGKLEFGPLWDFDRALNSTDGRDANPRVWRSQVSDRGTDFFNHPWWDRLFTDPDFYQEYIDRYQQLRRSNLSTVQVNALIDALGNEVRRAAARDWSRWGPSSRTPTYQGELNLMKTWLQARLDFMDSQWVRPPSFITTPGTIQPGSLISLNVPVGNAYYTLDGSDPRAPGGGIASQALTYVGPFPLNANARIRVRIRNPSHTALTGPNNPPLASIWSGPVTATFIPDPLPLAITEILYNPVDGPGHDREDFEFIELTNTGASPLNLDGCSISNAITYVFSPTNSIRQLAPGQRVILASNLEAFASRYPNVTHVLGPFSGRLANEGETIDLHGPLGEIIVSIPYLPEWSDLVASRVGHSLVPISESLAPTAYALGSNWTASAATNGSPGSVDPNSLPTPPGPTVALDSGQVVFTVPVPAGQIIEIQSRPDPLSGIWSPVIRYPAGNGRDESLRISPDTSARYFRSVRISN